MLFDFFASSIGAQVSYTVLALSHFVYVVDRAMAYMLTQRGVKLPSDNRRYILYSVADFLQVTVFMLLISITGYNPALPREVVTPYSRNLWACIALASLVLALWDLRLILSAMRKPHE